MAGKPDDLCSPQEKKRDTDQPKRIGVSRRGKKRRETRFRRFRQPNKRLVDPNQS